MIIFTLIVFALIFIRRKKNCHGIYIKSDGRIVTPVSLVGPQRADRM